MMVLIQMGVLCGSAFYMVSVESESLSLAALVVLLVLIAFVVGIGA